MSLTILEMEMGLPSTRSSSIILPGADGEFVKQLSEISDPLLRSAVEKLKFDKHGSRRLESRETPVVSIFLAPFFHFF